jgi:hypothetical protein
MKALETFFRRVFFYGAFVLLAVAAIEKIANILNQSLSGWAYPPYRLAQYAAIALLFAIAMQLNQIRLLLGSRPAEPPKQ